MFFAGVVVGAGGLLLFGYFFAKHEEKKTKAQLQEMANKLQDEKAIVNEEKGGETND